MTEHLPGASFRAPMSDKQICSLKESKLRVNIWEGSVRSGKTIASLLRWLIYVATSDVRGELVIISRTRDSAARNVFAPLMDPGLFGEAAQHVQYTSGAAYGTILGRRVWVLGSSDKRSENVLRGLTCAGAYVDEITLLKEDFFTQLLNRLWEGAQLFGTTNPDSPGHWFKVNFLDRLDILIDWISWKFLLDDNPMLSEERKAAIRRENTGLFYRRNVLGEWVAAEGAIFETFEPQPEKGFVVPWEQLPPMRDLLCVALDYGTTNATAVLLLGLSDEADEWGNPISKLYFIDEWRHDSRVAQYKLTDATLSKKIREWIDQPHLPATTAAKLKPMHTIIDPSAASLRVQLNEDGVNSTPADNDVSYGIRLMASLIAEKQLLISDRCTGLITEMPGYSWDPKATAKGEDKPLKVADHSIDAARYAVVTTESIWRHHVDLTA